MKTSTSPIKKEIVKSVSETDWGFGNANTKTITHEIHRYSGKYIPQIARKAIELISFPGETILDPYVGSGTTLLEANLCSRNSIGIDLNPLAVLITKVKITPVEKTALLKLKKYFEDLSCKISISRSGQASILNDSEKVFEYIAEDPRLNDDWYTKWFNKSVLKELLVLDKHITNYPHKKSSDIARVAFSNILRKCSNAHSGYPNVMLDKKKNNLTVPSSVFIKALKEIIDKVEELNHRFNKDTQAKILHGDARNLSFENNSIDAVITHPPYIGSVPYAEYGTLSLKWLGYEPKVLDSKLTGGKRQSKDVVERFWTNYKKMLEESYRVLKEDRYMFILIGDPTVKGKMIDLAEMTRVLSKEIGFELVAEKKRTGINRRANKMGPETLLFFRKIKS
jgi:DNA modification methylase